MRFACPALALAVALLLLSCSRGPAPAGVTVASLDPAGGAARAGLRVGDVLLSWQRDKSTGAAGAEGALGSCADLSRVEIQEAPQGTVTFQAERLGRTFSAEMPPDNWQIEVLPRQRRDPGCDAFARARLLSRSSRWPEARAAYAQAAAHARAHSQTLFAATALRHQGIAALRAQDFPGAEAAYTQALEICRKTAPDSLDEALAWHALGYMEQARGAIARSEEELHNALRIRRQLAPRSLEVAGTLNILGIDAWRRGDLEDAKRLYGESLAIVRARAPGSLDEGQVLNNLGLLLREIGDDTAAEGYYTQAAQILQRTAPGSIDLARTAANLATIASDRGDFARSEEHLRIALDRFEKIAPEGLEVADVLNNLGSIVRERYQLTEAEAYFRHSLAIQHRLAPGSEVEATSLSNLCWIAQNRDRLDEAEGLCRSALEIRSRQSPGGPTVAISLSMLGVIAMLRGNLPNATMFGERALALQHKLAPGSLYEGEYLEFLGNVAMRGGDLRRAETLLRQALVIHRRTAPRSVLEGEALDLLGRVLERQGRKQEAEAVFEQAAAAIEDQIGRLGGSDEGRSSFQAKFLEVYQHLIALQVSRGETAAALHTLERSRARSLLALLAQRDLAAGDAPTALLDRQRQLDRKYEDTQDALARLDPRHTAELETYTATLVHLRGERADLAARIARASPHYAALRSPQPLDLAGIRAVLDPGTVWLSYSVGEDKTYLFAVVPAGDPGPGVEVFTLPAGADRLAEQVSAFRSLILRGREKPALEPALVEAAQRLYKLLVAPAAATIASRRRVLLSPDGPLHILPFATLIEPGKARPGDPPVFLTEDKPLHTVLSATLYAEIRRTRSAGRGPEGSLVAFADPRIVPPEPGPVDDPGAPPTRRYRHGLAPLPGARAEVRALEALWGKDAHVYAGAEASEERLRHLPVRPRYLHFACHALLDRRSPLDSALALATPQKPNGEDNGLLQAWEIFERLRLDADLVTLSACETGLGRDAGGEGLIGLTRAFQYAGARSVLASLWVVNDDTTAVLMERFYTLLRAGQPKDLALQEAQRDLIHRHAHPVHWAAFTLNGDWM